MRVHQKKRGKASSRPYRSRRREPARLALAVVMAAIMAGPNGGAYVHAAPSDISQSPAPALGQAAPTPTTIADGDASVSSQTGAFAYALPLSVPPGRAGVQPSLALSYSSQSAIYGGVAAGWSLGVPEIREDVSQGRLRTHHQYWEAQQADPKADDRFVSSLSGGRPLRKVNEPVPTNAYGAYRAQNDASYTRYQRFAAGAPYRWRALTMDGATLEFGGATANACAAVVDDGYAPLTRSLDAWGNTIVYEYAWDADTSECRLAEVRWGANINDVSLKDFARVRFVYAAPVYCAGADVAIGASSDWRTGKLMVTGARPLTEIFAESIGYDAQQNVTVNHTRRYALTYATPGRSASGQCDVGHAPYRALTAVTESASTDGATWQTMPAVTFEYGTALIDRNAAGGTMPTLGAGATYNGGRPGIEQMMLDMDGDGRLDKVVSKPTFDPNDSSKIVACGAEIWLATGGVHQVSLPTMRWANAANANYGEAGACALNYQKSKAWNYGGVSQDPYLSYRWMDATGDGHVDIIASLEVTSSFHPDLESALGFAPLLGIGTHPVDGNGNMICPNLPAAPQLCVSVEPTMCAAADPTTTCAVGAVCQAQMALMGTCMVGNHPCGQDERSAGWSIGPTAEWIDQHAPANGPRPFARCGKYPWIVQANVGAGQFASPVVTWQPAPIDSESADDSLMGANYASRKSTVDIDGDGRVDVVNAGAPWSGTEKTGWWWNAFLSDSSGQLSLANYLMRGPDGEDLNQGVFLRTGDTLAAAQLLGDLIGTAALVDINGDGLLDWVHKPKVTSNNADGWPGPVRVAWNDGRGLRLKRFAAGEAPKGERALPNALVDFQRQRIINGAWVPGINSGAVNKPSSPGHLESGDKITMDRFMDMDADGRVDWVTMGNDPNGTPSVAYNLGGTFGPAVPLAGSGLGPIAKTKVAAGVAGGPSTWVNQADFVDVDHDGITEYVYADSAGLLLSRRHVTAGKPPRVLTAVHNGRGAHLAISYASMANATVVTQGQLGRASGTLWVVASLVSTDDFTETVGGYGGSYTNTTTYKYAYPQSLPDDEGRYAFRGFREVQVTSQSGAVSTETYSFAPDWSGRLQKRVAQAAPAERLGAGEVRAIQVIQVGAFTLLNGIEIFAPVTESNYVCKNGSDEANCMAQPASVTHGFSTYASLAGANGQGVQTVAFVASATRVAAAETGNTLADRRTAQTYAALYDADTYRVRGLVGTRETWDGTAWKLVKKGQTTWDSTLREARTAETWLTLNGDTNPLERAITTTTYDAQVGVPLTVKKPEQTALGGPVKTLGYDANKRFVISETNELGHLMEYEWHPGTGAKIADKGPNERSCTTCPITPTSPAREERRSVLDAFGREIEHWETISDQGGVYELGKISTLTFTDVPNLTSTPKVPVSVVAKKLINYGGTTWTEEKAEMDGHGRPLRKISYVKGTAPADAITNFRYDHDGTLVEMRLPDPAQNSSAQVTYEYQYDSLGRPILLRRPDATTPADRSGITMSYDGLVTTTEEFMGASGGKAGKKQSEVDRYGRLVQLKERSDVNGTADVWQTTTYAYALDDTLATITDPENGVTQLSHDMAGRRTQIARAGRLWQYTYDRNGNVVAEQAPGAANVTEAPLYTTVVAYDALDRVATKYPAPRTLSAADVAYFVAAKETFVWDYGVQRKGRLRYARQFTSTAATTWALLEDYQYDAQGHNTFVNHTASVAGYSNLTRQFGQRFTPWGGLNDTFYRDYVGGTNQTQAVVTYDARALPKSMVLYRTGQANQEIAVQTRNVAGLVTKRKTTQVAATGSMPWIESNWAYDGLGRITSQTVQKGPTGAPVQIAKQELGYFGNDNPMQLDHTAGPVGTAPKTFGFDYDYRHQLVAAQTYEANPEFVSDYEFGAAGRLARATVATSLTPGQNQNDVRARDVSYQYGDVDPERLTELRHASGAQQGQAYATYTYDAAGNQTQRSIVGEANWEYVYDGRNRLRRVVKKTPTGVVQGSEEYWYTTSGQRMLVQKRDAAGAKTELLWFIGDTQAHYDANGNVTKVYAHVSLGTPVARVERTANATTNLEYQFHGLANNTLATVATDGTVNTNLVYAPYGELVSATESGNGAGLAAHWRRFNDKFKDEISGLGYYGARYYDNVALGWTQADPLYRVMPDAARSEPRRANLYAFVMGNPVAYFDPDGLDGKPNLTTCEEESCGMGHGGSGHYRNDGTPEYVQDAQAYLSAAMEIDAEEAQAATDFMSDMAKEVPIQSGRLGWRGAKAFVPGVEAIALISQGKIWAATTSAAIDVSLMGAGKIIAGAGKLIVGAGKLTGAGKLIAAAGGAARLSRAAEYGMKPYGQLRKALLGTGLHAHHLIEKRFAGVMGQNASQMMSIAVTSAEHQAFTNAWRAIIPYGPNGTGAATRAMVMDAARQVYSSHPEILNALGL